MADHIIPEVIIRSRVTPGGDEFVVLCKGSAQVSGPFSALPDAISAALQQAQSSRARVYYEPHDERGRSTGERLLLHPPHAAG